MKVSISKEYKICPYQTGVKLLSPEQVTRESLYQHEDSLPTLADAFALQHNIYLLNHESQIQSLNTACAQSMRFMSIRDATNKSMFNISPHDFAKVVVENDLAVLKNKTPNITEDNIVFHDGSYLNYLSFKAPWYNENNKIIGVFGCSILFKDQPLAQSLIDVARLGLLKALSISCNNSKLTQGKLAGDVYLTKREKEILQHSIRGKTAKEIATLLYISRRTVEQHLEHIKQKLNVTSKSELIQKVLDHSLVSL